MRDGTILLKGGCLIDGREGLHAVKKDVLIENGVFAKIEDHIEPPENGKVLELKGAYVAPGFIDIHTHVFDVKARYGARAIGMPADMIGVAQGTTTVIDAGTAGPATIGDFVNDVVKKTRTRVYSAMHYATEGLKDPPEGDDPSKYDLEEGKQAYEAYAPYIVAIKARASATCVGKLGITSIKAGHDLARTVGLPMLVHIGHMPPLIEEVVELMDQGDIITHAFHGKDNNLLENGSIKPQTQEARDRGVVFDVGHGKDSFNFNTGLVARKLGFYPNTISTDLHCRSFHKPVHSLAETMSKFLALGYTLEECVDKVTGAPATYLRLNDLGKLKVGCDGDVTIFRVERGSYQFVDANKNELNGTEMIVPVCAVIGGEVQMDAEDIFHQLCRAAGVPRVYEGEYDYVARMAVAFLEEEGVHFDGDHLQPFLNHIIALLQRLRKEEHLPDMEEEMLEQLEPRTLELADALLEKINEWYGPADRTERILVGIHIQTSMES